MRRELSFQGRIAGDIDGLPARSRGREAVLYYDYDSQEFKLSVDGGPYESFAAGAGISPAPYGYAGDGVTDDTAAIQAALTAAASAGGGTVFLPAGSYGVAGTLSLPSNVCLQGASGAELVSLATSLPGAPLVKLEGTVTATVQALTANGTRGSRSVSIASSASFAVGDRCLVRDNVYFNAQDTEGRNQEIVKVASLTATSLTFTTPLGSLYQTAQTAQVVKLAPVIGAAVTDLSIRIPAGKTGGGVYGIRCVDCRFERVTVTGMNDWPAFRLDTCLNSGFVRCTAKDAFDVTLTTGGNYGFVLNEGCHYCFVEDSFSENVREDTFGNNTRSCRVSRLTNRGNRFGINSHGNGAFDCVIEGCQVDGCTFQGIHVAGSGADSYDQGIRIEGNTVKNCGGDGIDVIGSSTNGLPIQSVTIKGNHVIDCGLTEAASFGILVARAKDVVVSGNQIRSPNSGSNMSYSISVLSVESGLVNDNLIAENAVRGVGVNTCTRVMIDHNQFRGITSHNLRDDGGNTACTTRSNIADDTSVSLTGSGLTSSGNTWADSP